MSSQDIDGVYTEDLRIEMDLPCPRCTKVRGRRVVSEHTVAISTHGEAHCRRCFLLRPLTAEEFALVERSVARLMEELRQRQPGAEQRYRPDPYNHPDHTEVLP